MGSAFPPHSRAPIPQHPRVPSLPQTQQNSAQNAGGVWGWGARIPPGAAPASPPALFQGGFCTLRDYRGQRRLGFVSIVISLIFSRRGEAEGVAGKMDLALINHGGGGAPARPSLGGGDCGSARGLSWDPAKSPPGMHRCGPKKRIHRPKLPPGRVCGQGGPRAVTPPPPSSVTKSTLSTEAGDAPGQRQRGSLVPRVPIVPINFIPGLENNSVKTSAINARQGGSRLCGKAQSGVQGLNFRDFLSAKHGDVFRFPWQFPFLLLLFLLLFYYHYYPCVCTQASLHPQAQVRGVGAVHPQRNWKENRSRL